MDKPRYSYMKSIHETNINLETKTGVIETDASRGHEIQLSVISCSLYNQRAIETHSTIPYWSNYHDFFKSSEQTNEHVFS